MWRKLVLAILSAGFGSVPAMAAQDLDLTPSSKWVLNYSPDSCTLARGFGEGDDQIVVQFVKYEQSPNVEINLKGQRLDAWRSQPKVEIRFGSTGEFRATILNKYLTDSRPGKLEGVSAFGRFDNFDFSRMDGNRLSRKDRMELRKSNRETEASVDSAAFKAGDLEIRLKLGSMRAPLAALEKCTSELVASWGLDPVAMENLALWPEPIGTPTDWFGSFGDRKVYASEMARFRFRVKVDEKGVPTDCFVSLSSARQAIIDAICGHVLKSIRFWPAETKDGVAVPAYFVQSVSYLN